MTARRRRLLVLLVAVQVAVPAWATSRAVPHMFGFHMFTGYEPYAVTVLDEEGGPVEIDLSDWITVRREDVAWSPRLSRAICEDVPEADRVTVRQWGEDRVTEC